MCIYISLLHCHDMHIIIYIYIYIYILNDYIINYEAEIMTNDALCNIYDYINYEDQKYLYKPMTVIYYLPPSVFCGTISGNNEIKILIHSTCIVK